MSTEEPSNETPSVEETPPPSADAVGEAVEESAGGAEDPAEQTTEELVAAIAADLNVDTSKFDITKPSLGISSKIDKPDKKKLEDEVSAVNEQIKKLDTEKEEITAKIEAIHKENKNSETSTASNVLRDLKNEKKGLLDVRKDILQRRDIMKKSMDNLMNDQKSLRSNLKITTLEGITERIAQLKRKQETTSMSLAEEKRLIKEMDQLNASKKQVAKVSNLSSNIGSQKDDLNSVRDEEKEIYRQLDGITARINAQQEIVDKLREKEKGSKGQIPGLIKERDDVRKNINDKKQEIKELRDTFKSANNDWYDLQRAQRAHRKFRDAEQKRQYEKERAEKEKARLEEELKKIPYEQEMALCDYLVKYLENTFLNSGSKSTKEEKKPDVVQVKDDPFAGFKPVNKKTDDVFLKMGTTKGPRKRASKQQKKKSVDQPFRLNMDIFDDFSLLGLTPPTALEGVAASVDEVKAKKKWYSEQERGAVPTFKEIREAERAAKKKSTAPKSTTNGKKSGKKFDLSSDDFAPLGNSTSAAPVSALNSQWGQRAPSLAVAGIPTPTPAEAAVVDDEIPELDPQLDPTPAEIA